MVPWQVAQSPPNVPQTCPSCHPNDATTAAPSTAAATLSLVCPILAGYHWIFSKTLDLFHNCWFEQTLRFWIQFAPIKNHWYIWIIRKHIHIWIIMNHVHNCLSKHWKKLFFFQSPGCAWGASCRVPLQWLKSWPLRRIPKNWGSDLTNCGHDKLGLIYNDKLGH